MKEITMFSAEKSRMYAALRCIELELETKNSTDVKIKRIKEIMVEAGRELCPNE